MNEEYFRSVANPMRAKDVAIVFNVHVNTVYRLAKSGDLKSIRVSSKTIRFDKKDVYDYYVQKSNNTESR